MGKQINTLQTLQDKVDKQEAIITPLREEINKLKEVFIQEYEKLDNLKEDLSRFLIKDIETQSIEKQIKFALDEVDTMPRLKHAQKVFEKLGFYVSGYFPETNQRDVKIMLTKGDKKSYDKTLKGLEKIIPFIKSREINARGFASKLTGIEIDIFDHDLSEHYSVCLFIDSARVKDRFIIMKNNYPSHTFSTLEDVLKYIQDNYWYDESIK